MSDTITVNGLKFYQAACGDQNYFVATIAYTIHDYLKLNKDDALWLCTKDPHDKYGTIRLQHGNDVRFQQGNYEFDLDTEEELSLAYYLAARNPDEVRRFLEILQSGPEVVEEIKRLERLCGGEA